jgi:hypothetical protein
MTTTYHSRALGAALACALGLSGTAGAALVDRGGGFVYDTALDITWLADANYARTSGRDADGRMAWDAANAWAGQLVIHDTVRDRWFDDWRLPHLEPRNVPRLPSADGSTDLGYSNMSLRTELGHMYYVSLNNLGYCTPRPDNVCIEQPGWGLVDGSEADDESLFRNLMAGHYWADATALSANSGWFVDFSRGNQYIESRLSENYVWIVRDGDVAPRAGGVPAPATLYLVALALGICGLVRRRPGRRSALAQGCAQG